MYYDDIRLFHVFIPRVMGTRFDLLTSGVPEDLISPVWDDIRSELLHLESMLNRFDPSSEVSRCNSGTAHPGEELSGMIFECEKYKSRTVGLFDITKGEGTSLDFGGFAKGFALRFVRDRLVEAGVGSAFVDFGQSSILAIGEHPLGGGWRVSLKNPYDGTEICEIELRDTALSVSGNTPSYSGHIVDPHSGAAVDARRMVTVRSRDPLDAEVLSTALMIASSGDAAAVMDRFPDADVHRYEL